MDREHIFVEHSSHQQLKITEARVLLVRGIGTTILSIFILFIGAFFYFTKDDLFFLLIGVCCLCIGLFIILAGKLKQWIYKI